MNNQKPYIIRGLYEWCTDNEFTPHIVAFVDNNTNVPMQFVQNNQIILNIAFSAVKDLIINNEWVSFHASFSGNVMEVTIPTGNILAIFAKENGQGMQFELEPTKPTTPTPSSGGLKFVK